MAQKLQYAFVILILLIALAPPVVAQSEPCGPNQGVTVALPSGESLQPGNYEAVIEVGGQRTPVRIQVSCIQPASISSSVSTADASATGAPKPELPVAEPSPSARSEDPAQGSPAPVPVEMILVALIPVVLLALGLWIYFKIIQPRRQNGPYHRALGLLKEQQYAAALPLLTSVETKLPEQLRRDARFFIAFANVQLKNTEEAEHMLAALHREDPKDPNVAYLLAHIRVESKRYDQAEPVLEKIEANQQLHIHHAKKLLGIVKYRKALNALKDGRVDVASVLFEKVQGLGDFASQIPTDLRNRYVALGTKALFDKDLPEARRQFESLQNAVSKAPDEQRNRLAATAKIGLALVAWLEDTAESDSRIEQMLVEAARLLDPKGANEMPWPSKVEDKDITKRLEDLDAKTDAPAAAEADARWLCDLHFLRGMTVLRSWSRLDGEAAFQALQTKYDSALSRFACSHARDAEFRDVLMVVGLLMYYLHKPGLQQKQGVDLLRQAQRHDMRDPDVLEIINNRDRIELINADAVDKYLQVLDTYLNDHTVRKELRLALMKRLSKYQRVNGWNKRPDLTRAREVEPTVADVKKRSEILTARINELLDKNSNSEEVARVRKLIGEIAASSQQLISQAKTIEDQQSSLLTETGSELFKD